MPDLPIVLPDTAAAPKDYTLSGSQNLLLKTVRALIDGSGAGSAFLPTLQMLDPNGHVMWEGATPTTVAAGASADVSWFPGLGSLAGGTPPVASTVMPYAIVSLGSWTWPQPGATTVDWTGCSINTTDNTVIENTLGSDVLTPLTIKKAGIYLCYGSIGPWAEAWGTQAELINLGGSIGSLFGDSFLPNAFPLSFVPLNLQSMMGILLGHRETIDPPGGTPVQMEVNQNSGFNRTVSAALVVLRLTGNGSGI